MSEENLVFKRKPIPLSPEYRPLYKIAIILIILDNNSIRKSSSLLKLHLFSWAMRNDANMSLLIEFMKNEYLYKIDIFNIEPSLNRALVLCIAEGLITKTDDRYTITEKGVKMKNLIYNDSTILTKEKILSNTIGKGVTEKTIDTLKSNWKKYAKN